MLKLYFENVESQHFSRLLLRRRLPAVAWGTGGGGASAVVSQAAAAEQAAVASQAGTQAAARGACGRGGAGRRAAARGACNRTRGAAAGARWRWERTAARVGAQVAARRRTGREKGERGR